MPLKFYRRVSCYLSMKSQKLLMESLIGFVGLLIKTQEMLFYWSGSIVKIWSLFRKMEILNSLKHVKVSNLVIQHSQPLSKTWLLSLSVTLSRNIGNMKVLNKHNIFHTSSNHIFITILLILLGLNRRMPNYSVKMGYGLHFGFGIEGSIGSVYKIDASYLSPNVNMASRLEAATKQFGVPLLIRYYIIIK